MKLGITGGTGFVGGHVLALAAAQGHDVRALTRRPRPAEDGIAWVPGALDDRDSLEALVDGCDCVIHVAGVISARDERGFEAGNVDGTRAILDAAAARGVRRFVHVSSLAAREPGVSLYGASKARSEDCVTGSTLDWAIVRPPAIYGPGDRETLELFRMAKRRLLPMPPAGRLSLLHVEDLARLLLALAAPGAPGKALYEPDDGRQGGWSHRDFAMLLQAAVDRRALVVEVPAFALRLGAMVDRLVRGDGAKLTADRAAYFSHPDWVCSPGLAPPAALWTARIDTAEGLKATAEHYRRDGWL